MKTGKVFLLYLIAVILVFACVSTEEDENTEVAVVEEELKGYEGISYYIALGDIESAIEAYEKAFETNPDDPETANLYARLLMLAGDNDEARALLEELVAENAENISAYYSLSILAGIEGKEEEQKDYLETIIDKAPDDSDALAMLGELQLRDEELDGAEASFRQALVSDTENIIAVLGMGNVSLQKKKYNDAENYFDKAIELFSDYSFAYVDRAYARRNQGDYSGAIEDMTKAVELDPEYYWNYIDRGKIYLILTQQEDAAIDFAKAVELKPDYFLAYMYLGGIYYDLGISCYDKIDGWDWDQALAYWETALKNYKISAQLNAEYYFVYNPIGTLSYVFGDYEDAVDAFKLAFKNNRADYNNALLAALSYYRLGKDNDAVNYISPIAQTIPQDVWFYHVANYLKRIAYDVPLVNYYKTQTNETIKIKILFFLAVCYLIEGNTVSAETFLLDVENDGTVSNIIEKILAHAELERIR